MKKILYNIFILVLILALVSCGELNPPVSRPDTPSDGGAGDGSGDGTTDSGTQNPDSEGGLEFSVSFILNGNKFIPDSPLKVQWSGNNGVHRAETDADGIAKVKGLDGDYNVTVLNTPDGYIYNPNVYTTSNLRRDITIEFFEILTPTDRDKGTNFYDDIIDLSRTGHYRLKLTSSKPVYYQFVPRSPGAYVIESWVDVTDNNINPIANHHEGSSVWKNPTPIVCDRGGAESTYTKNFRLTIDVAPSNLSANGGIILCFGIYATLKEGEISKDNPVYIDFSVEYRGSVSDSGTSSNFVIPEDLPVTDVQIDKWNETISSWHERFSGGTLHNAEDLGSKSGSTVILNEQTVKYNEETGFYHVFNLSKYAETNGFGPILYAYITSSTIFIDAPLNHIEDAGNKALTVSKGTENYKLFIEGYSALVINQNANNPNGIGPYLCTNKCPCRGSGYYPDGDCPGSCPESCEKCDKDCRHLPIQYEHTKGYAQFVNSAGLCPVTKELQEFLQKFAVSQLLFKDGYGHAEREMTPRFSAYEGSQWLFACGYYE